MIETFRIEHDDVGMTLQTSIWFGSELLIEYLPGTRWPDVADQTAREVIARALRPLLMQSAKELDCMPPRDPDEPFHYLGD